MIRANVAPCQHEVKVTRHVQRRFGDRVATQEEVVCARCPERFSRVTLFVAPAEPIDYALPDLSID